MILACAAKAVLAVRSLPVEIKDGLASLPGEGVGERPLNDEI